MFTWMFTWMFQVSNLVFFVFGDLGLELTLQ